jgi:hypothetical protein
LLKNGPTILDKKLIAPAFSPTFIKPRKSDMTPINPIDICTPVLAESKTPSIIVLNISVSPKNTSLIKATIKATRKNAIQMKLSAMG